MTFRSRIFLSTGALGILAAGAYLALVWWIYYQDAGRPPKPDKPTVSISPVRGSLHLIEGLGGNITASVGPDGLLLVDTGDLGFDTEVLAAVGELTGAPAVFIINTHSHGDHRGNNWVFRAQGAEIIAHSWAAAAMRTDGYARSRAEDLPTIEIDDSMTLAFNGDEITITHIPNAHTQGDIYIYFQGSNVLATGDIFVHKGLPFISLGSKATLAGHIAAQRRLIERIDADTIVVPGHGPLATRADLLETNQALDRILTKTAWIKSLGVSIRYLPLFHPNQGWPSDWREFGMTDKDFTRMIWRSLE